MSNSDFWYYVTSDRAFWEFCHNKLFGIDSYLSRRIRHGTLAGTLVVPIQERISRFENDCDDLLLSSDRKQIRNVLDRYRSIVFKMRDELLHFKSKERPYGLFIPNARQTSTRKSIQVDFRNRIVQFFHDGYSASELCSLFLDHCWDLLTEDLYRIRNEVRDIFTAEIRPLLRSISHEHQAIVAWRALSSDLDQTVELLFSNFRRWFGKSEGSAMTVRIRELVTVVVEEGSEYFPNYKKRYRLFSACQKMDICLNLKNK